LQNKHRKTGAAPWRLDRSISIPPRPIQPDAPAVGVGARLRAAREAQGLSLKDIAARTRITARHVEALETGDYGTLPGRPYALGFARSYAKAVGLDRSRWPRRSAPNSSARAPAPEPA
jgi:cytoskeletal protein RodZ